MTKPLTFERRIEKLERDNNSLRDLLLSLGRNPQGHAKRWNYWAFTTEPSPGDGDYPGADGDNTFPIRFVDPTYTRTAGTRTLTVPPRSTDPISVGHTTNGQWCLPDELVMASPIPPPPGTTGKGRWLITPIKTYYYGFLEESLSRLGSANASVYRHGPAGTWTDTGYDQTVYEGRFLGVGQTLEANTWIRFEWESVAWVVTNAACAPEELS